MIDFGTASLAMIVSFIAGLVVCYGWLTREDEE